MSEIKKTFYNIFFQHKNCRNLFLLSKEELLDKNIVGEYPTRIEYPISRIIISNAFEDEYHETIRFRTETHNIHLDASLEEKLGHLKPLLEQFFSKRFKKSLDKLTKDLQERPVKLLSKALRIAFSEKNWEKNLMDFLHEYGFAGKHLTTFKDIESEMNKLLVPSKNNELLNYNSLDQIFNSINYVKDLYVNHLYKKLYSTTQVLTSTLNEEDNFESRLRLFKHLYDFKILSTSGEDAFIECSNCEPGTYRGVFKLKINPQKLDGLKCPVCQHQLTYFVPYELHPEIYEIVKSHDGLLLDALCELLKKNKISYSSNIKYFADLEIDCMYSKDNTIFIVETKMYKLNTTEEKLHEKVKGHYRRLIHNVTKLLEHEDFKGKTLHALLLTNIIKPRIIQDIVDDLNNNPINNTSISCTIATIDGLL